MRIATLLLVATLAPFAGCLDSDDGPAPADEPVDADPAMNTTLEPLHFSGSFAAGADPFNLVTGSPCSTAASTCFKHDFEVTGNRSVAVTATLAWGVMANDLDLYLFQGDTELSQDGINTLPPSGVPPPSQVLRHEGLAPGMYSFWVAIWNGVADDYTLDVEFA